MLTNREDSMRNIFIVFLAAIVAACTAGRMAGHDSAYIQAGGTPADLSAAWWRWAMAAPPETNPVGDATGEHCAVGQQGSVWFLAGGFGSSRISRRCVIPAEKYVFFPIITTAYWPAEGEIRYTCEDAKRNAAINNDGARDLFVELDGVAMDDPKGLRARTDACFDLYDQIDQPHRPYRAYPAAADGYWVLLSPLQRGKHTLRFGGRYSAPGQSGGDTVQEIEYEVMVE